MPKFALYIKAELTGVSELTWPQNHRWCIDIQESGSSETREGVYVSNEEQHDLQGSRGTANFVVRFGGRGSKEAYCQVEQAPSNSMCKAAYTAEDSGSWVPILVLECRGLEPVKWVPQGGFTVVSSGDSSTKFEDVDLSEDWCEYDEADDVSLEVMGIEGKWEPVK